MKKSDFSKYDLLSLVSVLLFGREKVDGEKKLDIRVFPYIQGISNFEIDFLDVLLSAKKILVFVPTTIVLAASRIIRLF